MIDKKRCEETEYIISSNYLTPLIYGDYSGLENKEIKQLKKFEERVAKNGAGHYTVADDSENFGICEICGKQSSICKVLFVVFKQEQ